MFSSRRPRSSFVPATLLCVALSACATDRLAGYSTTELAFVSGGDELRGTLALPLDRPGPFPAVLFVHGDGPVGREAHGYYRAFRKALAARGIASFSWDKPGVGKSTGDWLAQDMDDRAAAVIAAYRRSSAHERVDEDRIGVIGFSQAGWVLPRLADETWVNYLIFVSTAVDVIRQGDYFKRRRLELAGVADPVAAALPSETDRRILELLLSDDPDHAAYLELVERAREEGRRTEPMSEARFGFVASLVAEDATERLGDIDVPVLALFGEADLNVDVHDTIEVYSRVFAGDDRVRFEYRLFPDATHQLTKARHFNAQVPGLLALLKIGLLGDALFVDGALDAVADFASEHGGLPADRGERSVGTGGLSEWTPETTR